MASQEDEKTTTPNANFLSMEGLAEVSDKDESMMTKEKIMGGELLDEEEKSLVEEKKNENENVDDFPKEGTGKRILDMPLPAEPKREEEEEELVGGKNNVEVENGVTTSTIIDTSRGFGRTDFLIPRASFANQGASSSSETPSGGKTELPTDTVECKESLRKKRKVETQGDATSSDAASSSLLCDKMEETLFCSICHDILYRPVSLMPCLHTFCSYCLGLCLKEKAKSGRIQCPMARCEVTGAQRNAVVAKMLETIWETNPEKRRTEEDRVLFEENDILAQANYDLSVFKEEKEEYKTDDEDNADEAYGDDNSSSESFAAYCGICSNGLTSLPDELQCAKCKEYVCDQTCCIRKTLERIENETLQTTSFPMHSWISNSVERRILQEIFDKRNCSMQAAVEETLSEEHKNQGVCHKCGLAYTADALLEYRMKVPLSELTEAQQKRQDCWWGSNCRTQMKNPDHAERLNHACPQTRYN